MKRLSEELNCQRQNSESARQSLEQKIKAKEKEYQQVRHGELFNFDPEKNKSLGLFCVPDFLLIAVRFDT